MILACSLGDGVHGTWKCNVKNTFHLQWTEQIGFFVFLLRFTTYIPGKLVKLTTTIIDFLTNFSYEMKRDFLWCIYAFTLTSLFLLNARFSIQQQPVEIGNIFNDFFLYVKFLSSAKMSKLQLKLLYKLKICDFHPCDMVTERNRFWLIWI